MGPRSRGTRGSARGAAWGRERVGHAAALRHSLGSRWCVAWGCAGRSVELCTGAAWGCAGAQQRGAAQGRGSMGLCRGAGAWGCAGGSVGLRRGVA